MFKKFGGFIRNIQRSDDRTKKKWLVIFSGIGMAFIVVLWVFYLNATLPQIAAIQESTSTEAAAPSPSVNAPENSFLNTVGRGWTVVWNELKSNFNGARNSILESWDKFKNELSRTNNLDFEKPEEQTSTAPLPQN
ncbi:MAG: hypothetical protein ABSE68_00755 [Minisyncoccia bacterium]